MDTQPLPLFEQRSTRVAVERSVLEDLAEFQLVSAEFPHIGRRMAFLWGHPEFATYTDGLLTERQGKDRQGFPPKVLNAIFTLVQEHEKSFPNLKPKRSDLWHH